MSWMVCTLLAALLASLEQCFHRRYLADTHWSWEYMLGFNIGALTASIFFLSGVPFALHAHTVWLLLLSGLLWFGGCLYSFKADQHVQVTATNILSQLQMVLVCIGGLLLFEEELTLLKSLGMGLIFSASVLAVSSTRSHQTFNNGIFYKLVSVVLLSVVILVDKKLAALCPPALITISGFLLPSLFCISIRPETMRQAYVLGLRLRFMNVVLGGISAGSYYLLISALATGPVSLVFAIYQAKIALTFLLGFLFLGEREAFLLRLACSVIAVSGVVFLT